APLGLDMRLLRSLYGLVMGFLRNLDGLFASLANASLGFGMKLFCNLDGIFVGLAKLLDHLVLDFVGFLLRQLLLHLSSFPLQLLRALLVPFLRGLLGLAQDGLDLLVDL